MEKIRSKIEASIKFFEFTDLLIVTGISTLGYGLYIVEPAAAFIAVGSILLIMGALGSMRKTN